MKYLTLPTWCALKLLIHGIPEHPYATWYPTLESWAADSPSVYRLIDFALLAIIGSFFYNFLSTFF
jgi:hypothetical protein